jgi:hypothetical protein
MDSDAASNYLIRILHGPWIVEARGPLHHQHSESTLDPAQWGTVGEQPYKEGSESWHVDGYTLAHAGGRLVKDLGPTAVEHREWMGSWGGSSGNVVLGIARGMPVIGRDLQVWAGAVSGGRLEWLEGTPESTHDAAADLAPFLLPLRALAEFEAAGIPPDGWEWNPSDRVLSRRVD